MGACPPQGLRRERHQFLVVGIASRSRLSIRVVGGVYARKPQGEFDNRYKDAG